VLVPLCEWSEEVQKCILRWLHKNIPEWESFEVAPCAKLLGFLGPKAGSQNWEGPLKKYASRLQSIKNGQASVAVNAFIDNSRVVPVASYVAQLIPLPESFTERFDILSVIRCPNCMRHSDMFELHKYGGPKLRSISVASIAALTRTAVKTSSEWPEWVKQMQFAFNEFIALDHLRNHGQTTLLRRNCALTTGTLPQLLST